MVTAVTALFTLSIVYYVLLGMGNAATVKKIDDDEIFEDYIDDYYQDLNNNLEDVSNKKLCPKGYKTQNGINCVPICAYGCENGKCTSPDVCECEFGYEFVLNKCVPICTKPCKYGFCSTPGVCSCYFGTIWNEKLSSCVFNIETRYKRGFVGAELLFVQPWTTKQPLTTKKPMKKSAPKKTLKVTVKQ